MARISNKEIRHCGFLRTKILVIIAVCSPLVLGAILAVVTIKDEDRIGIMNVFYF